MDAKSKYLLKWVYFNWHKHRPLALMELGSLVVTVGSGAGSSTPDVPWQWEVVGLWTLPRTRW